MKKIAIVIGLSLMLCLSLVSCGKEMPTGSETETKKENDMTSYAMSFGSVTVRMRDDAAAVLSALGEPTSREETGSCAFGGSDVRYTYPDLILQTYTEDGREYVSLILLQNDSIATPEGVRIGVSTADVKRAYGTPASETATVLIYEKGISCFQFFVRDGVVTKIQLFLNF